MKLAIGTAQFGLSYGISNKHGQTSLKEIKEILKTTKKYNINLIDTASLYGQSEEILGKCLNKDNSFKIITKTPYFNGPEITSQDIIQLRTTVTTSLKKLNQKSIYGILIHNTDNLFLKNGELLLKELKKLKNESLVKKIGFSIYSPHQIDSLLDSFEFDIIQIPINILDQRLLIDGHLKKLKKSKIEIHARSIFLQGLLLMPLNEIPSFFKPIYNKLKEYHNKIRYNNITPLQAAIGFIKKIKEIDYIIIGINNKQQLTENINAYKEKIKKIDFKKFACFNEQIINPTNWKL
ncbi:aldo/keto reductase [Candidatus Babeliales bacterium]|nr:aldo/keto reductase [Candidatus Babeliales bacterium]